MYPGIRKIKCTKNENCIKIVRESYTSCSTYNLLNKMLIEKNISLIHFDKLTSFEFHSQEDNIPFIKGIQDDHSFYDKHIKSDLFLNIGGKIFTIDLGSTKTHSIFFDDHVKNDEGFIVYGWHGRDPDDPETFCYHGDFKISR